MPRVPFWLTCFASVWLVSTSRAQETTAPGADGTPQLPFETTPGPITARLGSVAEVAVPEGLAFIDAAGTRKFLELTQNIPSGNELGTVMSADESGATWFVIFTYLDTGHVDDSEKDKLDADDLLEQIQDANDGSNEARVERGWEELTIDGWQKPPFYDSKTNNLTWALIVSSPSGGKSVNWSTKLLGRRGTMNVDFIIDPAELDAALPAFESLLGGFSFQSDETYAQYKPGDKLAQYGLTALVVGGAGVAAAKLGFFAKFGALFVKLFGKFGKLVIVGLIAVGVAIKAAWGWLAGRSEPAAEEPPPELPSA
jgi:uncharacterized membrane-anchored protein